MVLTTDISVYGEYWVKTFQSLEDIFTKRTQYDIYMLSIAIGVMYDKRLPKDVNSDYVRYIPRNVVQNNDHGRLDYMYQAAIITTKTETYSEEERLRLAFDESDFNKIAFLTEFANYGVKKLYESIGTTSLQTMQNIKDFLFNSVDGNNLDMDGISEDILSEINITD